MNRGSVGQSPDQGGQKKKLHRNQIFYIHIPSRSSAYLVSNCHKVITLVWNWLYQAIETIQESGGPRRIIEGTGYELAHRIPLGLQ